MATLPSKFQQVQTNVPFGLDQALIDGNLVPPHSRLVLGQAFFLPKAIGEVTATIYLKNNLTILEPVVLRGEGGYGSFKFVDHRNVAIPALNFVITAEQLSSCNEPRM